MKKLLLFITLIAVSINFSQAQEVKDIIAKFNDVSKISTFDKEKFKNFSIQVDVQTQGQKMDMSVIKVGQEKMRFEISVMGQLIVMVLNGNDSFMIIPGQGIKDIPAGQVKEQTKQMDVIGNFVFDTKEHGYTLKSQEGDCYVVEQFKTKIPKKIIATIYFNKTTGLIDKIVSREKGFDVVTTLSQYKDFGGVQLPSVMSAKTNGEDVTMDIKGIDFDFPVLPYMFARPE